MSDSRRLAGKVGGMRRDPGEANATFFGFVDLPPRGAAPVIEPAVAFLPGRRGAAERDLMIEQTEDLTIALGGWYRDAVTLDERQANFLLETLTLWKAGRAPDD